MKLNKKGAADTDNTVQKNLLIFGEIAVAMILLLGAGTIAINKLEGGENLIIAKDFAFLIETVSASPYKLTYAYPVNLETKRVTINQEGSVTISSPKNTITEKFMPMRGIRVPDTTIRNSVSIMFFLYNNVLTIGQGGQLEDEEYCSSLPIPNKEDLLLGITYSSDATEKYLEKIKETMDLLSNKADGFRITSTAINDADYVLQLEFTDNNNLTIIYSSKETGIPRISCFLKTELGKTQRFNYTNKEIMDSSSDKIKIKLGSLEELKNQMNQSQPLDPQIYKEMEKYGITIMDALKKGVKN